MASSVETAALLASEITDSRLVILEDLRVMFNDVKIWKKKLFEGFLIIERQNYSFKYI